MYAIPLLAIAIAILLVLRRHPRLPRPPQPRHVSFDDASFRHRHRRRSSAPPQFVRRTPPPPPPPPQKSPRRLSPLRLSFSTRRRTSITSTLLQIDHLQNGAPLPPHTSPLPRTRFINPFSKNARSRTLSPPSTDTPSFSPPDVASPLPSFTARTARRTLADKFKSMFKSTSPQSSPITQPKLFVKSINAKLRRKPTARTQPYGPPWNAPMPIPDSSEHVLDNPTRTTSLTPRTSWKRTTSLFEKTTMSSAQLSSHNFINELDEKLLLLQQQRVQHLIPSSHA